ncbi:MAG: DNA mismatch repair protein MutS [Verrucomicrobia bacterium]|nr:DNA mismatch repair protein MutS [Verrucomicrobiota bacterium]
MSTPMMQQWQQCKQQAQGQILLFRMGDFYEAFYEDAETLASTLELTLTKRGDVPMSGIPWHAADGYIQRLVAQGLRVAIAEQMEDPKQTKGLVKRQIVRVVTPGTWISNEEHKQGHYVVALCQVGACFGLALLDITTATFQTIELEHETDLINELYRLDPKEIIISQNFASKHSSWFKESHLVVQLPNYVFEHDLAASLLLEHFKVMHLDSFGLKGMVAAINAAGALLHYMQQTLHLALDHITTMTPYCLTDVMGLDRTTLHNLELVESISPGGPTLLKTLDDTLTAMGGRLLREWIKRPTLNLTHIHQRQDAIEQFVHSDRVRAQLRQELRGIQDLEKMMTKVISHLASPRDLKALSLSLSHVAPIMELLKNFSAPLLQEKLAMLSNPQTLLQSIDQALVEEPPLRLGEGRLFQLGYHAELDELVKLTTDGKGWLLDYQTKIKEDTGIKNLKITFNRVFGYSIEVSKGQSHLVPADFERRQTLANAERFVTQKLKEYEQRVLTAEDQILALEKQLWLQLCQHVQLYHQQVFTTARALAHLDVLQGLSEVARKRDYTRPLVDHSDCLKMTEARHPVIEQLLGHQRFIPNSVVLGDNYGRMLLLTGPNMAGKSTYIRQIALILIMAQIGSFIPAQSAHLGVVDKIFTRIGASDDLARGQSTFMVEMSETANILHNTSSRSLVILDEIGRGTSTYDGLAIAWAVAEYLLLTEHRQAKTLFATHYWELTELSKNFPDVINAHAAVDETGGNIVFQHQIIAGVAQRSYGIHVAQLAGLPSPVIKRAQEILKKLEPKKAKTHESNAQQLLLF